VACGSRLHEALTIVAVYGHNDGASALPALIKSAAELPGARALLLSPAKPAGLPRHIAWSEIAPMDYRQYSLFVMYELHRFIATEFALIVQDDGWVLNGANFKDSYYAFDYIGAPCHAGIVGNTFYTGYAWQAFPDAVVIQNGGFSLRSKKFLSAPARHALPFYSGTQKVLQNEDTQLTGTLRPRLEALGITFAPLTIARNFAVEYLGPGFHDDLQFDALVGLHGQTRKLIGDHHIRYGLSEAAMDDIYRERDVVQFLVRAGYDVEFAV
jgi:hypothetical protein